MNPEPKSERIVVIHYAGSWTEALVLRSLLESAGITSPASTTTDPFPLSEPPKGIHGLEIQVLESQAEEARGILAEYLAQTQSNIEEENADAPSVPQGEHPSES